ncbi:hypothetical protein ACSSS7_003170 [Eimeria intestinalis]
MRISRHFLVAAASLFLLDASATGSETTRTVEFRTLCFLLILQAERGRKQIAGLAALTPKTNGLPLGIVNNPGSWDALCDAALKGVTLDIDEDVREYREIFSFFQLADGTTEPDCSGAVKYWQKGFSILNKSPPVNDSISDGMLNDKTISLVTLYNPSDEVQGDCRVIVCKEPLSPAQEAHVGGEADLKTGSGLLCLASPSPLKRKPLFT